MASGANPLATKRCNKCGVQKFLDDFSFHKTTKDHRRTYCKACAVLNDRVYRSRNPERARINALRREYGISWDEYQRLLNAQSSRCAICGLVEPLRVDHDHVTGRIRGLLCHGCNVSLGHFKDNVSTLLAAIQYLKREI